MSHEAKQTKDHNRIREWVEERGGKPATVEGTATEKEPGVLRIEFPGQGSEDQLKPIEWDDFFQKFDQSDLTFVFQEETAEGGLSRFNKFVRG